MEVLCLIFTMYNLGGGNSFKINSLAKRAVSTFFAVILFFALGATVDSREASGQMCPPGTIQSVIHFEYNSCLFKARFCYECPPTHLDTTTAEILDITAKDTACAYMLLDSATRRAILDSAMSSILIRMVTQLCAPGPCPVMGHFQVKRAMCFSWENFVYDLGGGNYLNELYLKACLDGAKCMKTFSSCWDYNFTPPKLIQTSTNWIPIGGEGKCEPEEPQVPPTGQTFNDNWSTDCFQVIVNCNN